MRSSRQIEICDWSPAWPAKFGDRLGSRPFRRLSKATDRREN